MRKVRIYQFGQYAEGEQLALSESASHHVSCVLRMKPGEKIILFSGDNREFEATILEIKKKEVLVLIEKAKYKSTESPCKIHLAQALSKGERMEFVIQKAVELGVATITPLVTSRTVVKIKEERLQKKLTQWQGIILNACEQSGRNMIPLLKPFLSLEEYLTTNNHYPLKLVLHPNFSKTIREYSGNYKDIALVIGPEGGFAEEEISKILEYDYQPLQLGPRILRTETAAIAALSVLQAYFGDL